MVFAKNVDVSHQELYTRIDPVRYCRDPALREIARSLSMTDKALLYERQVIEVMHRRNQQNDGKPRRQREEQSSTRLRSMKDVQNNNKPNS